MDVVPKTSTHHSFTRAGGTIAVVGDVTAHNRADLKELVLDALLEGERAIVLDFTHVGYPDSSALASLVSIGARCRDNGATFELRGVSAELHTLLATTRIGEVLTQRGASIVRCTCSEDALAPADDCPSHGDDA